MTVRVSKRFVDEVLWLEFSELDKTLRAYLDEVTARVVAKVLHEDVSEAAEVAAAPVLGPGGGRDP